MGERVPSILFRGFKIALACTLLVGYGIAAFLLAIPCLGQSAKSSATGKRPAASAKQSALALEQQGKIAEAEAAWKAFSKTHPADPEPYGHIGLLESRQQHYKDAVPFYRKALALNPNIPGLRLDLALALFKSEQLKEAIPQFKILLKEVPAGSSEAQRFTILIGMAYYGVAQYAEAAPYLKAATDRDSSNLTLLLALAHSYLWSKQSTKVLDVYHQILVLDPSSAEADMLAGEALDEMKDNAGATKMFEDAVKANPKAPNAHFGLGYLLWSQKKFPEAASEFNAELANDPEHIQSLLYLADTYIQLNKLEDAKPLLDKCLQRDTTLALAHLDLGIVYSDGAHNDDALKELEAAEKLMPDDINVHWRLARLYRTLGRRAEATAEFEKASTLNKAADDDLFKKIADGNAKHAAGAPASQSPPEK